MAKKKSEPLVIETPLMLIKTKYASYIGYITEMQGSHIAFAKLESQPNQMTIELDLNDVETINLIHDYDPSPF